MATCSSTICWTGGQTPRHRDTDTEVSPQARTQQNGHAHPANSRLRKVRPPAPMNLIFGPLGKGRAWQPQASPTTARPWLYSALPTWVHLPETRLSTYLPRQEPPWDPPALPGSVKIHQDDPQASASSPIRQSTATLSHQRISPIPSLKFSNAICSLSVAPGRASNPPARCLSLPQISLLPPWPHHPPSSQRALLENIKETFSQDKSLPVALHCVQNQTQISPVIHDPCPPLSPHHTPTPPAAPFCSQPWQAPPYRKASALVAAACSFLFTAHTAVPGRLPRPTCRQAPVPIPAGLISFSQSATASLIFQVLFST